MKASFVDLRRKSSEILRALNRNEKVTIFYRGQPKAVMYPVAAEGEREKPKTKDHAAFGLWADREDLKNVPAHVRRLRKGRFSDS
jgi:antitoxin (DNA-binding transcriptional repressor) of toxin-antitoxin stability system